MKPCVICAEPFIGRANRLYCSTACARRAHASSDAYKRAQAKRNAAQRPKVERNCLHCGSPWMVDTSSKSRYCTVSCAKTAEPSRGGPRRTRDLVHVGPADFSWLPSTHPVIRWAPVLQARPIATPRYWSAIASGPCGWCEENFTALSGSARYCSSRCSRNATVARRGKRFQIAPKKRLAIYVRDEWTCQLCREPVDPDLMVTDPYQDWAPSLDHIVPQSKGGGHNEANLRLAHRWCNAVRGAEDYHAELFAA